MPLHKGHSPVKIVKIDYIRYKHGLIDKRSDRNKLPELHLVGRDIPDELEALIDHNELLSLRGSYGLKEGAEPIEYDELRMKAGDTVCHLEVYNKGMSMMFAETPELKRIFQVCCKLQKMA